MTTFMMEPPGAQDLEEIEIDLLLEGIRRRYGCDFKEYDRGYIRQRVRTRLREEGVETASHLLERVLRRPASFDAFVDSPGEPGAALFRPSRVWRAIRHKALPALRTYPSVRAWVAGPSSDDDLLSVLVLLEEELSRPYTVYATDVGDRHERQTRFGRFSTGLLPGLSRSYAAAGGRRRLTDHLRAGEGWVTLLPPLRSRIVFASHHFATDASFNDFHLILARRSLSRFSPPLRDRSFRVIHGSLVRFGFLVLGPGESPEGTQQERAFRPIAHGAGIYQRVAE